MSAIPAAVSSKWRCTCTGLYRYCRLVHGWLSAFAFLAVCFFSVTGLLLNHPDWIEQSKPVAIELRFDLSADELARVQFASNPAEELARVAEKKTSVRGSFSAGNEIGDEVFARLQGVRGLTELRVNFKTGVLQVVVQPAPLLPQLNELHRAQRAGNQWRLVVDVAAIVLVVLSLVGYVIFFSLRYRLRTALLITAASLAGLWIVFVLTVH
jgi:uncharacterized protein